MRFNTSLLHAGVQKETNGSTLPPVYQTSAFEQTCATDLEKIFENKAPGFCYTRVGNPTVTAFENRITKLEGGIASIACASGMAALMNAFLNILRSGDEIVSSASLYGGTIDLFTDLEAFGITTRYVENNNWEQIEGAINEHTRLVFAETIGNPCLDVTDIEKLAGIAHAHELPLIVDNTTSTPYLIQVLKHGADIVVNSSSKYINGSSNSISGVLTDGGKFKWKKETYPGLADYLKFGPMAFIAKLRNGLFRNTGACLAPVNAYLNVIGLETLGLRMERQCSNAATLAKWIEETYPDVTVNYPGLESSPWHAIAKKQFENGYGAILTLRVGSKKQAFDFIDSLNIAYTLSNIGDTKTLVIHPGSTISLHSTEKQKEDAGVFEDLIRVSVGIEDIEDLKEDFAQAFAKILGEKDNLLSL
ncbi:MAG: aminotransferase class I/II-fold pyridoxal phosphate-dependent enzyme [Roseburia sp.]|nr:aminotransferase class I/II-fold pyridoxal phosphate-dependent enzyme [Roseburia sp.]